jgi:hypothetical protein
MFEILEDQMRVDDQRTTTKRERVMLWGAITLLSIVLFGALYMGLHLMGS